MSDVSEVQFTIREMVPEQADSVAGLLLAGNEEHLRTFPADVATSYRAELADVDGRLPTCDVLVAEAGGRLVGTVTLVRDADDDGHPWPPGGAVLRLLAVHPDARGHGVGSRLASACIDRAEALGARFVGLHTAPVMESARRLYERLGFRPAPEHDFEPGAHYGSQPGRSGERWGLAYILDLPRLKDPS